jgi:hypothetical protein
VLHPTQPVVTADNSGCCHSFKPKIVLQTSGLVSLPEGLINVGQLGEEVAGDTAEAVDEGGVGCTCSGGL